jgi:hypothetical protein
MSLSLLLFRGASPAGRISLADAAIGSEAFALLASLAQADSGIGSEAFALLAAIAQADTGSGADVFALVATDQASDGASGLDAISLLGIIGQADAGAGSDALAPVAAVPLTDAGSGNEVYALVAVDQSIDSGAGADQASIAAIIAQMDAASGDDSAVSVSVGLNLADAGIGADALSTWEQQPLPSGGGPFVVGKTTDLIPIGWPRRQALFKGWDASDGDDRLAVAVWLDAVTDSARGSAQLTIEKLDPDLELIAVALAT